MNPYLALLALLLMASTLLLLPLTPALVELRRKSDAKPLNVIQQHAGEIRYFVEGFRSYLKSLETALRDGVGSGTSTSGTLPDGTDYLVAGLGEEGCALPLNKREQLCPVLIAACTDLVLPTETTFSKEIYALGHVTGGGKDRCRAILGEKDVHLGGESSILRWAHAVGEFHADENCGLYGRVSSDRALFLKRGCRFQRLNAPRIEIGTQTRNASGRNGDPAVPADSRMRQRLLLDGDFVVGPEETFYGNLVVRGSLQIGAGARVLGSIKGNKNVVLEDRVSVQGSLISAQAMQIGRDCTIHGPVIAERFVQIESGTRCGSTDRPTTVSAPWIEVEEGVVVFGTLWAREHGRVVERS